MTPDASLFVQAFWVKVREVIRPEIDAAIDELRGAGHHGSVSTQEYSEVPDELPAHAGPSITLALRPAHAAEDAVHPALEFHGDVARETVEVLTSDGRSQSFEIAALGTAEVKVMIDEWLARLAPKSTA
jgi:hypothetical protein